MKYPMLALGLLVLAGCGPRDAGEAKAPDAPPAATPPAAEAPAEVMPATEAAMPATAAEPAAAPAADAAATGNADAPDVDQSIDAVLGDHAAYRKLLGELQSAVASGDKAAAAALVSYPLQATVAGKPKTIQDAAAFVAQYDAIMTDEIKKVIGAQQYAGVMVNAQGVMLGDGQVWLNGVCVDKACTKSTPRVVTLQAGPK